MSKLDDLLKSMETETPKEAAPSDAEKQAYINTVMFSGRLSKDVELKAAGNKKLVKSSMALWQPGKDAATMWFDLVVWIDTDTMSLASEFLEMKKGQSVVVEGSLRMRMYQEKPYYTINVSRIG